MPQAPPAVLDLLAENRGDTALDGLGDVWAAYASARRTGGSPFSSAVSVAAACDRLGHAFAVGYPAALEHLIPGVELPCALCVTEAEGNSPRAIATTLEAVGEGYVLDGTKTFVTFGALAQALIVVARAGEKPDGRPDLAVVCIPADRDGVALVELPETPFVPEVPHARVRFEGVIVAGDERLPGDGYLRYVKPFRTIEDIHVFGATLGYAIGWARRTGAEADLLAALCSDLVALDRLRAFEPLDPQAHIALEGVYRHVTATLSGAAFERMLEGSSENERRRWARDKALLAVASKARQARFARAIEDIG